MYYATQNCVLEFSFRSGKDYKDPFNEVELDVVFQGPDDSKTVVPAFWASENVWKVRFSTPTIAGYSYTTICSDKKNLTLHNQKGEVEVRPYQGKNPLLKDGPLRVSGNRRYLEHIDGTPFLWLADTWWMGLCKRLSWPEDFRVLTEDRVKKSFSVIQLIVGSYAELGAFDERGANEAGFSWEEDYSRINPAYFDMADLRIEHLVNSGLLPCITGCWGYHLPWMGLEKMKKHWRYLIARYSAYPVVWCLAGEALMPYYLSTNKEKEVKIQKTGWTEVTRYVREKDPHQHPVTIHPTGFGYSRGQIEDPSLVDFDMLQTSHGDWWIIPTHVKMVIESVNREPKVPVLIGEVCYEGHAGTAWEDMQRFLFWSSILSGTCGHTYGADGIWQVNTREKPFGCSVHGGTYSATAWQDACQLPGSAQMGIAKRLLERYPWWQLEPHPEWMEFHWKSGWQRDKYFTSYAAGIPKKLRIVYFPPQRRFQPIIQGLESDVTYHAFYHDPRTGKEYPLGRVKPNAKKKWTAPPFPIFQDGILVLEGYEG